MHRIEQFIYFLRFSEQSEEANFDSVAKDSGVSYLKKMITLFETRNKFLRAQIKNLFEGRKPLLQREISQEK